MKGPPDSERYEEKPGSVTAIRSSLTDRHQPPAADCYYCTPPYSQRDCRRLTKAETGQSTCREGTRPTACNSSQRGVAWSWSPIPRPHPCLSAAGLILTGARVSPSGPHALVQAVPRQNHSPWELTHPALCEATVPYPLGFPQCSSPPRPPSTALVSCLPRGQKLRPSQALRCPRPRPVRFPVRKPTGPKGRTHKQILKSTQERMHSRNAFYKQQTF
ncbi:uncharacterized protein [Symphalangus syndactylus]|uniref:uncharacterized protein isoform X1 n=1 Tax=Symphalangus syndactylus TaxID=9590 RepID=UPI0030069B4B